MTYDAENRMTATAGVTYTYDGDGKRVKKSNGKLYWYGLSADPLLETDLAGNNATEFIFFKGKRVARRDSAGAISYFFSDHLGSSRVVTSATGGIVDESDFYPFGGERVITSTSGNNYKFTGKERDTESGLDYFAARYYSSQFGRFMTPDWADTPTTVPYADFGNPQSLNLYTYVGNNPITRFDVDGHCWPANECAAAFQNAVDSASKKIINAVSNSGSGVLAGSVTLAVGMTRDVINGTADAFKAGEAVGACMDNCTGVEMGDAIGQDLGRTAGLVAMAAGGSEAVLEKVTQRALTKAATEALETVGPGKGGVHGTKVHTEFAKKVDPKKSGVTTEVSYKNGDVVPRGTPGSIRVDAVRGNPARPQGVYDVKTGGAKLDAARKAEIQKHLPRRTTIREIRPAQ
jgi:RHS repeat-associated protein